MRPASKDSPPPPAGPILPPIDDHARPKKQPRKPDRSEGGKLSASQDAAGRASSPKAKRPVAQMTLSELMGVAPARSPPKATRKSRKLLAEHRETLEKAWNDNLHIPWYDQERLEMRKGRKTKAQRSRSPSTSKAGGKEAMARSATAPGTELSPSVSEPLPKATTMLASSMPARLASMEIPRRSPTGRVLPPVYATSPPPAWIHPAFQMPSPSIFSRSPLSAARRSPPSPSSAQKAARPAKSQRRRPDDSEEPQPQAPPPAQEPVHSEPPPDPNTPEPLAGPPPEEIGDPRRTLVYPSDSGLARQPSELPVPPHEAASTTRSVAEDEYAEDEGFDDVPLDDEMPRALTELVPLPEEVEAVAVEPDPATTPATATQYTFKDVQRMLAQEREATAKEAAEAALIREQRLRLDFQRRLDGEREQALEHQRAIARERERAEAEARERERELERQRLLEAELELARDLARQAEKEREKAERWAVDQERERQLEAARFREEEEQAARRRERAFQERYTIEGVEREGRLLITTQQQEVFNFAICILVIVVEEDAARSKLAVEERDAFGGLADPRHLMGGMRQLLQQQQEALQRSEEERRRQEAAATLSRWELQCGLERNALLVEELEGRKGVEQEEMSGLMALHRWEQEGWRLSSRGSGGARTTPGACGEFLPLAAFWLGGDAAPSTPPAYTPMAPVTSAVPVAPHVLEAGYVPFDARGVVAEPASPMIAIASHILNAGHLRFDGSGISKAPDAPLVRIAPHVLSAEHLRFDAAGVWVAPAAPSVPIAPHLLRRGYLPFDAHRVDAVPKTTSSPTSPSIVPHVLSGGYLRLQHYDVSSEPSSRMFPSIASHVLASGYVRLITGAASQDARPGPGPSDGVAVAAHVLRAGYLALAGSVKATPSSPASAAPSATPRISPHVIDAGYLRFGPKGILSMEEPLVNSSATLPGSPTSPSIAPHVLGAGYLHLGPKVSIVGRPVEGPTIASHVLAAGYLRFGPDGVLPLSTTDSPARAIAVAIAPHVLRAGYLQLAPSQRIEGFPPTAASNTATADRQPVGIASHVLSTGYLRLPSGPPPSGPPASAPAVLIASHILSVGYLSLSPTNGPQMVTSPATTSLPPVRIAAHVLESGYLSLGPGKVLAENLMALDETISKTSLQIAPHVLQCGYLRWGPENVDLALVPTSSASVDGSVPLCISSHLLSVGYLRLGTEGATAAKAGEGAGEPRLLRVTSHVLTAGYMQWRPDGGCMVKSPPEGVSTAGTKPAVPSIAEHILRVGYLRWGSDGSSQVEASPATEAVGAVAVAAHVLAPGYLRFGPEGLQASPSDGPGGPGGSVPIAAHVLEAGYLQLAPGSFAVALQGTYVDISSYSQEMNHPALE
eukprot:EG_transcript_609